MVGFQCLQCGHCCLAAGDTLYITEKDVIRWEKQHRKDILGRLFLVRFHCDKCGNEWPSYAKNECSDCGIPGSGIFYWIDESMPLNFLAQLMGAPQCPFLEKVGRGKYSCKIHETKPEICKEFPELNESEVTKNEEERIDWKCKGYMKWKKAVNRRKRVEE